MIDAIFGAATALNAGSTIAAIRSNNIANMQTPGFKSKMAALSELSSGGVNIRAVRENGVAGSAIPTGNPRDIAIFGKYNQEAVNGIYSSMGRRFAIDDFGNLKGPGGELLFTGSGGNVTLDRDGNLYKNGSLIGTITPADEAYIPTGYSVLSGFVEGSNVDIADEMAGTITNQRYFEFNAVTIRTADDMLGTIVNMKG